MLRWPVDPVRAVAARSLPQPGATALAYEMKWDGFRAVIWRTRDGIRIQSRHGTDLTRYFPDLLAPLAATLPAKTVIDGEVLVWDTQRGRCDFALLQRRLTAGRRLTDVVRQYPAHFVAFDLLRDGRGVELLDQPLTARRAKLQRLLRRAPAQIVLCPQTDDPHLAHGWLSEFGVAGVEGVVVKAAAGRYRPGSAGWTKVRTRATADYVIGGVTGSLARPVSLLLGRFDDHGVLRYAGQTHPITAGQRRELIAGLRGLPFQGAGHPWPCPLPAGWSGGLSEHAPQPFTPVEPTVVAEVEIDTALDGPFGLIRHRCRHVRTRLDLHPADIRTAEPHHTPRRARSAPQHLQATRHGGGS
jgi:ATP-dependent DNA ligase